MNSFSFKVAAFFATLLSVSSVYSNDSCTVTSYDKVEAATKSCQNLVIDGITVPAGKSLDLSLRTGASLTFKGIIKFLKQNWAGPLCTIIGTNLKINGAGSVLDGQGTQYWDGKGENGCKKPKLLRIKTIGSTISNIKLLNCPIQCVSINSAQDTVLTGFTIDVSAGDKNKIGKNTDGFDLSNSRGITVENSVITNQDDCVAVNQGSNYVFRNLTCIGGHGLSLSVGQSKENGEKNTLRNVTFSNCVVAKSRNGIHVKTHSDAGTGSISDVTYQGITIKGATNFGVSIQQDYEKGKSTGNAKGNIPIKNLNFKQVTGSMSGGSNAMPVHILCGSGGCSGWNWSGVSITNGQKENQCNFKPSGFKF